MDIRKVKIGTRLDFELINSLKEKIGQTYISQLIDIIDAENIVIAAPIHESRFIVITSGTKVRVGFSHKRFGFLSFLGTINGKEKRGNILIFLIKITSPMEKIQRRKYYRLECSLDVFYHVFEDDFTGAGDEKTEPILEYKKAITKNISGNGISMVSDEQIPKGSRIEVILQLNSGLPIKTRCKVVRSEKLDNIGHSKFDHGLFFDRLSHRDQEVLVKYIFDLQRQQLKRI